MRSARTLSRGLAVLAAGMFSVSLVAALAHTPTEKPTPEQRAEAAKPLPVVPLLSKTAPANNPTELVLLPDETGVRGWIAGAKSYAGAKVSAKAGKAEHAAQRRLGRLPAFGPCGPCDGVGAANRGRGSTTIVQSRAGTR